GGGLAEGGVGGVGLSVGWARSSGPQSGASGGSGGRGGSGSSIGLAGSCGPHEGGSGGVGGCGLPPGLVRWVSTSGECGAAWAAVTGITAASTARPRAATIARHRAARAPPRGPARKRAPCGVGGVGVGGGVRPPSWGGGLWGGGGRGGAGP